MNNYNDGGMAEPFGPTYVRPDLACANCTCCTAELCELGRASTRSCVGHVRSEHRMNVTDCPCSSETARGSLAWRALKIRAVATATEKPLPEMLETILQAVADGTRVIDTGAGLRVLAARRYLDLPPSGPRLTHFGRMYVAARREPRQATPILVHSVDMRARTAQVVVMGRAADRLVTVPLDILANKRTGLTPAQLPGATLHAYANCAAVLDDDVVLTQVQNLRAAARFSAGVRAARQGHAPDGGQ